MIWQNIMCENRENFILKLFTISYRLSTDIGTICQS